MIALEKPEGLLFAPNLANLLNIELLPCAAKSFFKCGIFFIRAESSSYKKMRIVCLVPAVERERAARESESALRELRVRVRVPQESESAAREAQHSQEDPARV